MVGYLHPLVMKVSVAASYQIMLTSHVEATQIIMVALLVVAVMLASVASAQVAAEVTEVPTA